MITCLAPHHCRCIYEFYRTKEELHPEVEPQGRVSALATIEHQKRASHDVRRRTLTFVYVERKTQ